MILIFDKVWNLGSKVGNLGTFSKLCGDRSVILKSVLEPASRQIVTISYTLMSVFNASIILQFSRNCYSNSVVCFVDASNDCVHA